MLLWTAVVLLLVQVIISCIMQSMLEEYIRDESVPEEQRIEVFKFYGTFSRTMLTMFEITLGNWMPPCRALVENVGEWYMLFSLFHKLIIGFSVVSVITGVFIQETFKVATTDDQIMLLQKDRAVKMHSQKMDKLFKLADENGDGLLDQEEFEAVTTDPVVRKWLSAMELQVEDAGHLFVLIDDGDKRLSASELVRGAAKMKGPARSIDLLTLDYHFREANQLVRDELADIRTALAHVSPLPPWAGGAEA